MEVTLWKRDMLSGMSRSVIAEAALAADRDFHSNIFSIITGEKTMEIYKGKSVFGGIAIGRISVYQKKEQQVKRVKIENPDKEMERYEKAKAEGIRQLQGLYDKALKEVGEANAAIFEVHQMMMEDDGYNESVENIIRSQGVNAEYAVAATGDNYAQMFSAMDDDYMRERAADVRDISERLLTILNGESAEAMDEDEPKIIVAEDLAPSETVQMDKDKVPFFYHCKGIPEFPYCHSGKNHGDSCTCEYRSVSG